MRSTSLAIFLLFAAGCQFDPTGVRGEDRPSDAGGLIDATVTDAALLDAALADAAPPDAALADAAPLDAGSAPDARAAPCGSAGEYIEWPDNGHFYRLVTSSAEWNPARTTCEDDGAYLVVIGDQAENDHVRSLSGNGNLWIGLSDQDDEDTFVWANGVELDEDNDFASWNNGEPNNQGEEDCVEMRGNGSWNDSSCGDRREFVCECDPE